MGWLAAAAADTETTIRISRSPFMLALPFAAATNDDGGMEL